MTGGRPSGGPARVAVLNYGMGNLRSVVRALEAVGAEVGLAATPAEARRVDGVVLPGVGALGDCMDGLRRDGLDDFVRGWVGEGRPLLGVCLGLQALFEWSEEGGVRGLGLLPGPVVRFVSRPGRVIPHMGWNTVEFTPSGAVLADGQPPEASFYFVHSYHAVPADPGLVGGWTDYGGRFASVVVRGALWATQFHPEKSQACGLGIYRRYLESLTGCARPPAPALSVS